MGLIDHRIEEYIIPALIAVAILGGVALGSITFIVAPIIALVVVIGLFYWLFLPILRGGERNKGLQSFASRIGARFERGNWFTYPFVSGEYKRRRFVASFLNRGTKRKKLYFFVCMYANAPFDMRISKEGIISALGKTVGLTKEIKVRDEQFDSMFVIKTDNELRAIGLLNPLLRPRITELFQKEGINFLSVGNEKEVKEFLPDLLPTALGIVPEALKAKGGVYAEKRADFVPEEGNRYILDALSAIADEIEK